MQGHARKLILNISRHIKSQGSIWNGKQTQAVSSKYHGVLANDCQAIINIVPHSVNKEYKKIFLDLFIELEEYFRTCLIKGRRTELGTTTQYKAWRSRIKELQ